MSTDQERELLHRVNAIDDFCGSALFRDNLSDWQLAKEFGIFLVTRLGHDDLLVHLLLARAHRHLGEAEKAHAELSRCRSLIAEGKAPSNVEEEPLLQTLEIEEGLMSPGDR